MKIYFLELKGMWKIFRRIGDGKNKICSNTHELLLFAQFHFALLILAGRFVSPLSSFGVGTKGCRRNKDRERRKANGGTMAPVPASVARQAELLKQDGNSYFKKERLGAAIDAYTEVCIPLLISLSRG